MDRIQLLAPSRSPSGSRTGTSLYPRRRLSDLVVEDSSDCDGSKDAGIVKSFIGSAVAAASSGLDDSG